MPFIQWVWRNKLSTLLILVVAYFLLKNFGGPVGVSTLSIPGGELATPDERGIAVPGIGGIYPNPYPPQAAPAPEVKNRLVVQESQMSLLVKNVSQTLEAVKAKTTTLGGYMVESNLSTPQDAASGQITVRVPQAKLDEALTVFRGLSVKVVSENLQGEDVTDQYVDLDAHLKPLLDNKNRFEELMRQAAKIEDILQIQQEIINLQNQIDSIQGQKNYLQKTAEMAKITIYLSTDELSLPYAPSQPWRPEVIFKQAVRSLFSNAQKLGSLIIWLVVYSVILIPLVLIIRLLVSKTKSLPH